MSFMSRILHKAIPDDCGQGIAEYAVMAAVTILIVFGILTMIGAARVRYSLMLDTLSARLGSFRHSPARVRSSVRMFCVVSYRVFNDVWTKADGLTEQRKPERWKSLINTLISEKK